MKNLKQELENIKEGKTSFLGIDGGNIKAKTWICGVEFGGDLIGMEKYIKSTVKYYNDEEFNLPIPYREDAGEYQKSTYDRFLSAMYINMFKDEILMDGTNIKPIEQVLINELYNKNSRIFKLNLYPLAKKSTEWNKKIESEFHIKKEIYYGEIFSKRKKFLKDLVGKFQPDCIICTAPNDYKDLFIEAFLNNKELIQYKWDYLDSENNKFKISIYKTDKISLIIIPFLGRGNLSSYKHVLKMADYLKVNYLN